MKNQIDSNFAIAILALVSACVGFSFWLSQSIDDMPKVSAPSTVVQQIQNSDMQKLEAKPQNVEVFDLEWTTYTNEEYGFSVDHPMDMSVSQSVNQAVIGKNSPCADNPKKCKTITFAFNGGEGGQNLDFTITVRSKGEDLRKTMLTSEWITGILTACQVYGSVVGHTNSFHFLGGSSSSILSESKKIEEDCNDGIYTKNYQKIFSSLRVF